MMCSETEGLQKDPLAAQLQGDLTIVCRGQILE